MIVLRIRRTVWLRRFGFLWDDEAMERWTLSACSSNYWTVDGRSSFISIIPHLLSIRLLAPPCTFKPPVSIRKVLPAAGGVLQPLDLLSSQLRWGRRRRDVRPSVGGLQGATDAAGDGARDGHAWGEAAGGGGGRGSWTSGVRQRRGCPRERRRPTRLLPCDHHHPPPPPPPCSTPTPRS